MGIITQIRQLLARRREEPQSEIQNDIEAYRRQQRQQMKVDAIMDYEKRHFLYGEDKYETS